DTLRGGGGADSFVFETATDSMTGQRDVIEDFEQGIDLIDVSAIASFAFIGDAAFEASGASQLRFVQRNVSSLTVVEGDVDGDGLTDFQVALTGLLTIQASDFVL
ncbi:M10 family metallopeptidase C-terminal domain-containing protein, partial [Aestuariivirga sp.]|uniref:M10 family metallopeptidase C-terminal domain-containing protein n=1 Tax=Aestuariivirga sp. TaxID=2650926 RepID=UPI003594594A